MSKPNIIKLHVAELKPESLSSFESRLRNPAFSAGVMRFSPVLATHILENKNIGNRPIKPRKVTQYAADMTAGNWGLTGDTIKFGTDGLLKDGQNRLRACVESGADFTSVVVFGVDPDLFHKMDVGKPRNPADILSIAGYKNAHWLASSLRWASLFDSDAVESRRSFLPSEMLSAAKRIGDMSDDISAAAAIYRLNRFPIGIAAALHREFARRDASAAAEFFAAWQQGIYKGRFRILEKLNKALALERERGRGRVHEFVYIALTVTAWNAFVDGRVGTRSEFEWDVQRDELPKIGG